MELLEFSFSAFNIVPAFSFVLVLLLLDFCYFVVLTVVGGQTVGKMAFGLRVEEFGGSLARSVHAVIRTVICVFSLMPVGLGYRGGLFPGEQAVHDIISNTRVARIR